MSQRSKPRQASLDLFERRESASKTVERKAPSMSTSGDERAEPSVLSVTQAVSRAGAVLERNFASVWVEGEVSNVRTSPGGHVFFSLKDERSRLAAVAFGSTVRRLGFRIEDGQRLRCRGRLTIYDAQGRFQINVSQAEPAGVGALQLAVKQLRDKLKREGLFERRRPLPLLPRKIAVVTSPTGAAVRDIIRVACRRMPVHVIVCPASVQGSDAAFSVSSGLRRADGLNADLIIVGRGGGSLEDLMAFNDERVVRTIASLSTPVISAVGHEIDTTLADLAADCRAATPSAAAEIAVPTMEELRRQLAQHARRVSSAMQQRCRDSALRLARLQQRLSSPAGLLDRRRLLLDDLAVRAERVLRRRMSARQRALSVFARRVEVRDPAARLRHARRLLVELRARLMHLAQRRLALSETLQTIEQRLRTAMSRQFHRHRVGLTSAEARIGALSPLAVLSRGYSVAVDASGRAVRDASEVDVGAALRLRLWRGELQVAVTDIETD